MDAFVQARGESPAAPFGFVAMVKHFVFRVWVTLRYRLGNPPRSRRLRSSSSSQLL